MPVKLEQKNSSQDHGLVYVAGVANDMDLLISVLCQHKIYVAISQDYSDIFLWSQH